MYLPWLHAIFIGMIIIVSILVVITLNDEEKVIPSEIKLFNDQKLLNTTKYILVWTTYFGRKDFGLPAKGFELFKSCKVKDCYLTSKNDLLPVEDYAAILFYTPRNRKYKDRTEIPEKRNLHQRYIFGNFEAPIRFHGERKTQFILNSFYNWTLTYRFDSDLIRRFGRVVKRPSARHIDKNILTRKTRSVAWIVSNCNDTTNNREDIATKLQQYLDVDIYGSCGNLTCKKYSSSCTRMIADKYWFYLAFENSDCRDYTTEKLYYTLQDNIVPIVYGGGDYYDLKVAPPYSFIDVKQFKKIETLANYLKFLMSHEELYLEYFQWKLKYSIEPFNFACSLCEKLHNSNEPSKMYEDIEYWWFSKNMSKCKSEDELPKFV